MKKRTVISRLMAMGLTAALIISLNGCGSYSDALAELIAKGQARLDAQNQSASAGSSGNYGSSSGNSVSGSGNTGSSSGSSGSYSYGGSSSSQSFSDRKEEIAEKLDIIDSVLNDYYLYDDEMDTDAMIEGIYSGYVEGLNEPYTHYYTEEEFNEMLESSSGEYSGIGVMVQQDVNTGAITVVRPFEGSPGYNAGMKKDDILFTVDGEEVTGVDINVVVARIKGPEGTTVDITVYRKSEDRYIDMTIERKVIQTPTVEYELRDDGIGYISVMEFDDVTVDQFDQAISTLLNQGAKGLIFDIRDNPGGLLSSVCDMLDRILPENQLIVYTLDKYEEKDDYYTENPDTVDVPMVVLVNGNSASASEIFTACLQDYGKATIVGTTTFGKGIVQVIIPLGDGTGLKITESSYYTPNGVCIHGEGVTPDVVVELDPDQKDDDGNVVDIQLDKAVETLLEMVR